MTTRGSCRVHGLKNEALIVAPHAVSGLSSVALASVLDQSVDCVKLIGLDGNIRYMNGNGICAMEIDDFCAVEGQPWADLWPDEARQAIIGSYPQAATGQTVRFRAFCPTAKGSPRWWDVTVSPVTDNAGDHAGYLSVSRDITETETAREALEIAAAEMKHRLKNTYSMIGSLLIGFAKGNADNEAFAHEMAERMGALSTAQELFVSDEVPLELDRLIPALVTPFDQPACPVTIERLSSSIVDQGQANAIALVIGELAVNSAKHGALHHGGNVHVSAVEELESLTILWVERSNQPVLARDRTGGQGLRLMERIVRARRGIIAYDWDDSGLSVRLTFRG